MNDNTGIINANAAKVAMLMSDVGVAIEDAFNATSASLASVGKNDANNLSLEDVNKRLDSVEAVVQQFNGVDIESLPELETRMREVESKVDDFDSTINDLPDLSNLDPDDIESRLSDMESKLEDIPDPGDFPDFDDIDRRISSLETSVGNLEEMADRISALEAQIKDQDKLLAPMKVIFAMFAAHSNA